MAFIVRKITSWLEPTHLTQRHACGFTGGAFVLGNTYMCFEVRQLGLASAYFLEL